MKSTLVRCVWRIGEGFNDTIDGMKQKLSEIIGVELDHKVFDMLHKDIEAGHGESVLTIKSPALEGAVAQVTIKHKESEKDIFGDIVPAHVEIVYQNLEA